MLKHWTMICFFGKYLNERFFKLKYGNSSKLYINIFQKEILTFYFQKIPLIISYKLAISGFVCVLFADGGVEKSRFAPKEFRRVHQTAQELQATASAR